MYIIYALIDPRDLSVHYVGMTNNLTERYIAHVTNRETNTQKNMWILELRGKGLLPMCRTLETCDTERQARERESAWIEGFIDIDHPLYNKEKVGRQR